MQHGSVDIYLNIGCTSVYKVLFSVQTSTIIG